VQGFMIRPKSARIAYDSREPRSVFVAIEGLDGCGKSTVARLLARRIQAFYYPTPPPLYRKIRHAVDGSHSRVEHFHFYVAALIRASREIEMLLEQGPVVADRYLASTAAYHAPWLNGDLRVLDGLPIIAPNATVLLLAEENERLARLQSRDGTAADSWYDTLSQREATLQVFRRFATVEVDTTNKTVPEVVRVITHELQDRGVLR